MYLGLPRKEASWHTVLAVDKELTSLGPGLGWARGKPIAKARQCWGCCAMRKMDDGTWWQRPSQFSPSDGAE